jgi:hypothetical protein
MSHPLWMSIEPVGSEVRMMLTEPAASTVMKARMPNPPAHPRAVISFLEAIALWYGQPLRAVIDADAEDVRQNPARWARLLGDAPELAVAVQWAAVPRLAKKDRFLAPMGDFTSARQLVSYAATGQR